MEIIFHETFINMNYAVCNMPKVYVIGLDGGSWNVLRSLIENNKMPNLKKIMEKGVYGKLRSTVPPITCPAWLSFKTGKKLGNLGVYDFFERDPKTYTTKLSSFYNKKSFWDYLSDSGYKVALINIPTTYPPTPINGIMITGMLTPSEKSNFTYPKDLKEEINRICGRYRIDVDHHCYNNEKNLVQDLYLLIKKRKKVCQHIIKKYNPDFLMIVFTETDRIQHFFWRHIDPQHPLHDKKNSKKYIDLFNEFWVQIDNTIGEIVKNLNEEDYLIIMSDHGFGTQDQFFYINDFLIREGLLCIKKAIHKKRVYITKFIEILSKLRVYERIMSILPRKYLNFFIKKFSMTEYPDFENIIGAIDWKKTKAYSIKHSGLFGNIYINLKGREKEGSVLPSEYVKTKKLIIEKMKRLKSEFEDEIFKVEVYDRDEIYKGKFVHKAPDIIFSINDYRCISDGSIGHSKLIEKKSKLLQSGGHRIDGILVIKGKKIEQRGEIETVNICDIAPTILKIFNVPIKNMDGNILLH